MKRLALIGFVALGMLTTAFGTETPPTAGAVLAGAQQKAKAEQKSVLVIFHASWCGWCKKMDSVLTKPEIKTIMDKHFVTVHLTVMETAEKKADENPGGDLVMKANGGEKAGLPFFYMSNAEGKMIMNSIRPAVEGDKGGNVGCPYEANEIEHFMKMLAKSAPRLTSAEANTVRNAFAALKKADGKG